MHVGAVADTPTASYTHALCSALNGTLGSRGTHSGTQRRHRSAHLKVLLQLFRRDLVIYAAYENRPAVHFLLVGI